MREMLFSEIVESVLMKDRVSNTNVPPPRPPKPRPEGDGPKGGTYWFKNTSLIPITGTVHEIVNRSGLAVILMPEDFGMSQEDIKNILYKTPSTREEYDYYHDENTKHMPNGAYLWKSSQVIFQHMLESGWIWCKYNPPSSALFIVTPSAARQQISAISDKLALAQITTISVTLATDFQGLNDRHPNMSRCKTLTFGNGDYKGFMGTFGAVMDWTDGKEAPVGNYLYTYGRLSNRDFIPSAFQPHKLNVKTDVGYRLRYAVPFTTKQPNPKPEFSMFRIATSAGKMVGREMTQPNMKGSVIIYSSRTDLHFKPSEVEVFQNGKWIDYDKSEKPSDF